MHLHLFFHSAHHLHTAQPKAILFYRNISKCLKNVTNISHDKGSILQIITGKEQNVTGISAGNATGFLLFEFVTGNEESIGFSHVNFLYPASKSSAVTALYNGFFSMITESTVKLVLFFVIGI